MKNIGQFGFFLFLTALFIVSSSCKKKKDKEPDNTEKLTSVTWLLTSAKVVPAVTPDALPIPISSFYNQMEPCVLDNRIKFSSNSTYSYDVSSNKCTDEQNYSAAWSLQNNETMLEISNFGGKGVPVKFMLTELTASLLTVQYAISYESELRVILKAYGLESLLGTSKTTSPGVAAGTKVTLVYRAL